MKKALLILMMVLLPWQAAMASQRNLTHLLSGASTASLQAHLAEHEAYIPHHHHDHDDDDDDDQTVPHQDGSAKSFQHLHDFDQGGTLNLLWHTQLTLAHTEAATSTPALPTDGYVSRNTHPPLRPPRQPA
ncbi:hypothetical protein [Pseudoduganella danionis]|uniref:hypothetical protein n=1 Tax=Pseudoduganella danionis TaxID=1890295 RepID=UPI0035B3C0CC